MSAPRPSQIERVELAIVEFLKSQLHTDTMIAVQPDDPEAWAMPELCQRAVLVHFTQSVPSRTAPAVKLQGRTGFAIICLARGLRGDSSGYGLVEDVETAMAGATEIPGCKEFAVLRSALVSQEGGLWRWVVEVETETLRGRIRPPAAPFIEQFRSNQP